MKVLMRGWAMGLYELRVFRPKRKMVPSNR